MRKAILALVLAVANGSATAAEASNPVSITRLGQPNFCSTLETYDDKGIR